MGRRHGGHRERPADDVPSRSTRAQVVPGEEQRRQEGEHRALREGLAHVEVQHAVRGVGIGRGGDHGGRRPEERPRVEEHEDGCHEREDHDGGFE